jgi:hypothetical protein
MDGKIQILFLAVLVCIGMAVGGCAAAPAASPTAALTATGMPIPSSTPEPVPITVYFTDTNRYAVGTPPFEVGVARMAPAGISLPEAVLQAFFEGPTAAEQAQGLEAITSGFTGFEALRIEDGIARVYLQGECASLGATYSVAQPIMTNLLQFAEIAYVKIYDENGETEQAAGEVNSIPFCLEP